MKSVFDELEQALWSDRLNVKEFPEYQPLEQTTYVRRLMRSSVVLPFALASVAIDALFILPTLPNHMHDPRTRLLHLSPFAIQRNAKVTYIRMLNAIQETGLVGMAEQIRDMPKVTRGSEEEKKQIQKMECILKQMYLFLSYSTIELPLSEYDEAHNAMTEYLLDTVPGEASKLVDTLCVQCATLLAAIETKKE